MSSIAEMKVHYLVGKLLPVVAVLVAGTLYLTTASGGAGGRLAKCIVLVWPQELVLGRKLSAWHSVDPSSVSLGYWPWFTGLTCSLILGLLISRIRLRQSVGLVWVLLFVAFSTSILDARGLMIVDYGFISLVVSCGLMLGTVTFAAVAWRNS